MGDRVAGGGWAWWPTAVGGGAAARATSFYIFFTFSSLLFSLLSVFKLTNLKQYPRKPRSTKKVLYLYLGLRSVLVLAFRTALQQYPLGSVSDLWCTEVTVRQLCRVRLRLMLGTVVMSSWPRNYYDLFARFWLFCRFWLCNSRSFFWLFVAGIYSARVET